MRFEQLEDIRIVNLAEADQAIAVSPREIAGIRVWQPLNRYVTPPARPAPLRRLLS